MRPARRPRLMHDPANAVVEIRRRVPAMRLSTVLAAWGPSGMADWQLIRSGRSDGAAQSPAATMRGSSTLVSVSSVSKPAHRVGAQPTGAARSGTPKPAVQTVIALGRTAPSPKTTASGRTSVTTSVSSTATRSLASTLATDRRPGHGQRRPQPAATDQGDVAALLGELGGRLDTGQPGADDSDRRVRVQVVEGSPQTLSLLEFCDGISEFGRAGHRCRNDARAADRVDEVVVVQGGAGRHLDCAVRGVDADGGVDDQPDALAEQAAVVGGGVVVAGHQLVQPDPLDELRSGIDERDVDVAAHAQMVGRECSGIAAADDDDLGSRGEPRIVCCVLLSHALKTPPTRRS